VRSTPALSAATNPFPKAKEAMKFVPLEILLFLVLAGLLFKLFLRLLNGKKLDKVIDQVTNPEINSDEEVLDSIARTKKRLEQRVGESDAELKRRIDKNERLRKSYGG
jgi:hypothetical protein